MIDLTNQTYWQSIKYDVINHIPTIHSGYGYGEWFNIVKLMKCSGLTREEISIWCAQDGEPNNSTWNGIKTEDFENIGKYRGVLVKKAREHGFKLPPMDKHTSLLYDSKSWLRMMSDDDDFCRNFIRNMPPVINEYDDKPFEDYIIKLYLNS